MTQALATGAAEIARRIADVIDPVFALIDGWQHGLEARLASEPEPRAADLDPAVAATVAAELDRPGTLITGAGFVAAPGYLADAPWHLAWWLSDGNPFRGVPARGIRRLDAVSDPDAESFRDYTTLEWWRVPERTGSRHLTGPYVDYLCTDDYTVTVTTPVTIDGDMVGLVGADMYVARLEQVLAPVLRDAGRTLTVVNASGRIVTSTDPHRATGALLRLDGLPDALAPLREAEAEGRVTDAVRLPGGADVVPCGDTSLALVAE
ncbi:PDC sensor domain-containing protein [Agromyces sp. SYSU T00266]|uniref:PDC sensor domain-containing protein n=1 Tax=Agromyces zhanjiangensis TaxID=3158562 RepID=UPI0033974525